MIKQLGELGEPTCEGNFTKERVKMDYYNGTLTILDLQCWESQHYMLQQARPHPVLIATYVLSLITIPEVPQLMVITDKQQETILPNCAENLLLISTSNGSVMLTTSVVSNPAVVFRLNEQNIENTFCRNETSCPDDVQCDVSTTYRSDSPESDLKVSVLYEADIHNSTAVTRTWEFCIRVVVTSLATPSPGTPAPGQGTPAPGQGTPAPGQGTPQPGKETPGPEQGTKTTTEKQTSSGNILVWQSKVIAVCVVITYFMPT